METTAQTRCFTAEGFSLSPGQRKSWKLREAHPCAFFGIQCVVRVNERLGVDRLDQAIRRVRKRHEILRTRFALLEGTMVPLQVVDDLVSGLDAKLDLLGQHAQKSREEIEHLKLQQWREVCGDSLGRALSVALVTKSDQAAMLVITGSALCADEAALEMFVHEIAEAYTGAAYDDSPALQYADVAEWQNQVIAAPEEHSPYWTAEKFAILDFPTLPFERRRNDSAEFRPATICRNVPQTIASALSTVAAQQGVATGTVLMVAWQILIQRLSRVERFLIGTTFDGRAHEELSDLIGPFETSMAVALDGSGGPCCDELGKQLHKALEVARLDQFLFDPEKIRFSNGSSKRCLFPMLFQVRKRTVVVPSGVEWEIESWEECLETFDLRATAVESAGCTLDIKLTWNSSIFHQNDIELLGNSYIALLGSMAANPNGRASEFPVQDVTSTLGLFRRPAHDGAACSVLELIEEQIARVPESPGVVCNGDQLTYAQLNRRSSIVASRLKRAGVGPDTVVAILGERSTNFVVGILATFKAGAAWLPIELDTPLQRIQYMVQQAQAVALLKQSDVKLSLDLSIPVVPLDGLDESDAILPTTYSPPDPKQLAYVIFTSGSTGYPKGVAVEHRQLSAYLDGFLSELNLPDRPQCALVSTMMADLGHTPVFAALASGGCLHIVPSHQSLDTKALARYFVRHPMDVIKIVPAHLEALCDSLLESTALQWRYLIVGGEPLTWSLVEKVQRLAPGCTIVNEYGPTETTIGVLSGKAELESREFCTPEVPIGVPRPAVSAYVLDEQLQPVPAWIPGELYVGGRYVCRGYAGRGDLTAEKFLPDPFHSRPGSRMYRTGDMARYRGDGIVEFLGRRDGQIKIRGCRIELGEIEAALCRHPDVQRAVALAVDDGSPGKRVLAWVAVGSSTVMAEELRAFLEKTLPKFMIPNRLMCVDQLKLTPNGKVDRSALAAFTPPQVSAEFSEPLDGMEESLLAVWQKVLGMQQIGVEDNYFALGGDSLRVIQLVYEAQQYGITILARDVLRYPTIRQLRNATQAERQQDLSFDGIPESVPIHKSNEYQFLENVVDCYPLSGMQTFFVQEYARNCGSSGIYHVQSSFRMQAARFSLEALMSAFEAVVQRHPALRTVIDLESSPPLQVVLRRVNWTVKVADISNLEKKLQDFHIAGVLKADRANLFDLTDHESPLFRVAVFLLSENEFILLFSCHHAIIDGWGKRVLLNQLVEAYTSFSSGAQPRLGEPDTTYREFVRFQRAVLRWGKASSFWRHYLADVEPPKLAIRGSYSSLEDNRQIEIQVNPEVVAALKAAARSRSLSLQALVLAAWLEALRQWSGHKVMMTGVVANGRSSYLRDPLSAVGLFWNLVPIVSREQKPLMEAAAMVHHDLIEMEPYQTYPLPQLLKDTGHDNLFFASFKYLNFWNTKEIPEKSGLRLLSAIGHDRFSFLVDCSVQISSAADHGNIQLEYDPEALSQAYIQKLMDGYVVLLEEAASAARS
jgi:amino acid adenylation domain-containing protein